MDDFQPLKTRLFALRLRQEDLAAYMGWSIPTTSHKLNGKSDITVTEMWRIADYLGMEVGEILTFFPPIKKGERNGRKVPA